MPKQKPIIFKVYPEKRGRDWGWYFLVKIFPDKASFNDYLIRKGCEGIDGHTAGLVSTHKAFWVDENGKMERKRDIGHIHLMRECLGSEVIAHEASHAAIGWAREVELDIEKIFDLSGTGSVTDENERFCYALGQIVRQIVNRCYKLDLYKE